MNRLLILLTMTILASCRSIEIPVTISNYLEKKGNFHYKITNGNKTLLDTTIETIELNWRNKRVLSKKLNINFKKSICFFYNGTEMKYCAKLKHKKYLFIDIFPLKIEIESADIRILM